MMTSINIMAAKTKRVASLLLAVLSASPALGQPFVSPIGGVAYQDWTIVNYVDLEDRVPPNLPPGVPDTRDYQGRTGVQAYTYNGHRAIDFTLANFAAMEAGVPVLAAAAGTVIDRVVGNPDHCSNRLGSGHACTTPDNWVAIQHPSGVVTQYVHLSQNTNIPIGQAVLAGGQIGLVGSSGTDTSDAHLHFVVYQNRADFNARRNQVETYSNAAAWWINPIAYAGDVPGSLDHGITDHEPTIQELVERPAEDYIFYQSDCPGQPVWLWTHLHGIDTGDDLALYLYRPNGFLYAPPDVFDLPEIHYDWRNSELVLPTIADLGTWSIQVKLNGATLFTDDFTVVPQETWLGGVGNWNDVAKWQYDVPNQYANVVIENGEALLHSAILGEACDLKVGGPSSSSNGKVTLFVPSFAPEGGRLQTRNAYIGASGQGSGAVRVLGTGSRWTNGGNLFVGYQSTGTNTLDIQAGGYVFSGSGFIGESAGSFGRVSIDGFGSRWVNGSDLRAGNAGIGILNVTRGGSVSNNRGWIGVQPNSSGTAVVDGLGSTWTNADYLDVGNGGQGLLTVSNGGIVFAAQVNVGEQGTLRGNGTIHANPVLNYGDVRPGAPVGTMSIFGTYGQLSSGALYIELQEDSYDKLVVSGGTLILDGKLEVSILGGEPFWTPGIGESFDILDWQGNLISGQFSSVVLPPLPSSLRWDQMQLYVSGVIRVVAAAGLSGDFNNNGTVDAADYVVWRNSQGTTNSLPNDSGIGGTIGAAHYNLWRANFGATRGSGAALPSAEPLSGAVPEPTFVLALVSAVPALTLRRRLRKQ